MSATTSNRVITTVTTYEEKALDAIVKVQAEILDYVKSAVKFVDGKVSDVELPFELPEFDKRGVKVIGLSTDGLSDHEKWGQDIEDVTGHALNYPLISDTDHAVAEAYDMLPGGAGSTLPEVLTVRSVFVIAPDNPVKLTLTYPAATGRNFDEILRVVDSLQLTANSPVATPSDWKQGDDVIIAPAVSDEDAAEKFGEFDAKKPYLRLTKQPS